MYMMHAMLAPYFTNIVAPILFFTGDAAGMGLRARFQSRLSAWVPAPIIACAAMILITAVGGTGHQTLADLLGIGSCAVFFAAAAFEFWRARADDFEGVGRCSSSSCCSRPASFWRCSDRGPATYIPQIRRWHFFREPFNSWTSV